MDLTTIKNFNIDDDIRDVYTNKTKIIESKEENIIINEGIGLLKNFFTYNYEVCELYGLTFDLDPTDLFTMLYTLTFIYCDNTSKQIHLKLLLKCNPIKITSSGKYFY